MSKISIRVDTSKAMAEIMTVHAMALSAEGTIAILRAWGEPDKARRQTILDEAAASIAAAHAMSTTANLLSPPVKVTKIRIERVPSRWYKRLWNWRRIRKARKDLIEVIRKQGGEG